MIIKYFLLILCTVLFFTGKTLTGQDKTGTTEYIFNEGFKNYSKSNYYAAIKDFAKVYRVDKKNKKNKELYYKTLVRQGDIEYEREHFDKARRLYSRAIGVIGGDEALLWKLKTIYDIKKHVQSERKKSNRKIQNIIKTINVIGEQVQSETEKNNREIRKIIKFGIISGFSLFFVFIIVMGMVVKRRKKESAFTDILAMLPNLGKHEKEQLLKSVIGSSRQVVLPALPGTEPNQNNVKVISDEIDTFGGSVSVLAHLIDSKTKRQGHSEKVAEYAVRIAELTADDSIDPLFIKHAALLHDIGYLGIKGKFNINETPFPEKNHSAPGEAISAHTTQGSKIMRSFGMPDGFEDIVLSHHERYDGSGIPGKISGDDIPLPALIVGAAEFLESSISNNLDPAGIPALRLKRLFGKKVGTILSMYISTIYSKI